MRRDWLHVQALLFLEEMASIVLTPFVLYFSLPKCAPAILAFVCDFTVHVPGVGDICSLGAFDFERHGNSKYGSPSQAPKVTPYRASNLPLHGSLKDIVHSDCFRSFPFGVYIRLVLNAVNLCY